VITGIVLAAGSSSRLGRPKQLLDLGGKPLVRHVVDAALGSSLDDVVVVVGRASDAVRDILPSDRRLRVVHNTRYAEGQSTSLVAGVEAASEATEAVVVLLGDQPAISADAIDAVVHGYRERRSPIVQASYSGTPAHPTLVDRTLWPELLAVHGDEGARSVIDRHRPDRTLVEVGGTVPADIDTEDDYRSAMRDQSHGT
jgi:molybdenum cofactor cytidylyltransferase